MTDNLFEHIRKIVSQIPKGKVATYSQIAKLAGTKDARKAGWSIKGNKDPDIPCHRVAKAEGSLPTNYSLGDQKEEKGKLLSEGVTFLDETTVGLAKNL